MRITSFRDLGKSGKTCLERENVARVTSDQGNGNSKVKDSLTHKVHVYIKGNNNSFRDLRACLKEKEEAALNNGFY